MTYKIYDEDSYIVEFYANVISCDMKDDKYIAVLDRTAFFPEEGGQCCDKGTINGIEVLYVENVNGIIYHHINGALVSGTKVFGKIDWALRFRNMQNHTAEHIVSGLVNKLHGYENVGFHLGEYEVTADYDHVLSKQELDEIEIHANQAVYNNVKINTWYPDVAELEKISFRSKNIEYDKLRLVEIEGYDVCACCAPHVKRSGEIGLIKIVSSEKLRGGTRVRILCSRDALADYSDKSKQTLNISNLLCAKQNEVYYSVKKLKEENDTLKQRNSELCKIIANIKADLIEETEGNIVIKENELEFDYLRIVFNRCKEKCNIACVISGDDTEGYRFVLGSNKVSVKERIKDINFALSGRGGGNDEMIRGTFLASEDKIRQYFEC